MWKACEDRPFRDLMSLITGLQLFWINLEVIKCWTLLSIQIILRHYFERPLEQVTESIFPPLLLEDRISFSLLMRTHRVISEDGQLIKVFNEVKENLSCKNEFGGTVDSVCHSHLCSFIQQLFYMVSFLWAKHWVRCWWYCKECDNQRGHRQLAAV